MLTDKKTVRKFYEIKERNCRLETFFYFFQNMFGEDQHFTPMDVSSDKGLSEAFRISG